MFVAHSMGGLVVQEALVTARGTEEFKSIVNNTIGILFFATPHRGTHLAKMLDWFQKITFSPRLFVRRLHLTPETSKKLDEFADVAKNISIISFSESTYTRKFLLSMPEV